MLELFILMLLFLPILVVLVHAFIVSKDYYDYDEKKSRYISRVIK